MNREFTIVCLCLIFLLVPQYGSAQQSGADDLEISLEDLLNTEISTATKYDKKVSEVPASVSIITSEDIERYGYENLGEVLAQLSGFYMSYDRNYYYMGARGFGRPTDYNNRIKLLLDGMSLNEAYYGSTSIGADLPINMDAIERIEVVRGPGSTLYGTGAMFSVINIITKDVSTKDGLNLATKSGSYGAKGTSGLLNKELGPKTTVSLSGTWMQTDGQTLFFPEYDGLTTNYGVAEALDWSKYGSARGRLEHDGLVFTGFYTYGEKGVPTAAYETDFNHEETWTKDQMAWFSASYGQRLSPTISASFDARYNYYNYLGGWPYEDFVTWDANYCHSVGGEAQMSWDVVPSDRFIGGIEYNRHLQAEYEYWGEDEEIYYQGDHPYTVFSAYAQNEFQAMQNLSLTLGLRHDEYTVAGSFTSPRAAVVFHPAELTAVKLLYGKAFRAPSVYEMRYEDPWLLYIPNPDLEPEEIETYEAVVEQKIGKYLFGKVSLYTYNMDKLIDYYFDDVEGTTQFCNVGDVTAKGVEVEAQVRMAFGLAGYANYTYEDTRDKESDVRLSNSPEHMVKAGLSSAVARHFSVGTEVYYESERTTVWETNTESFVLTNVTFSIAPKLNPASTMGEILNRTKLSVRVKNVLDEEYANPGGWEHLMDQIPQDGRTFTAKLSHSF